MIDEGSLGHWSQIAPWLDPVHVEQDLILSRALIDIFNHQLLSKQLAFRGGTALQKCFYEKATRYSEDIDLVQIGSAPIGPVFDALREVLEPWLGKPNKKVGAGRATLYYRFETASPNPVKKKVKIEINTREHFSVFGLKEIPFEVESRWYTGKTTIQTYTIEELLATKLRALFQRKKGRDLYDLAVALRQLPINVEKIVACFADYMKEMDLKVSRAEFEMNLFNKKINPAFKEDIIPLLAVNTKHNFEEDFNLVLKHIIAKLPGEPWAGVKEQQGEERG